MIRKQAHPRGPLLYLSQSEGVLAALWLSGGCQISSASTCQFTLENARRYLWWAVQSCVTKTSHWKRSKNPEKETSGICFSIFKQSDESSIYIVSFIDKTCFFAFVCLLSLIGCMILLIALWEKKNSLQSRADDQSLFFLNHSWAWMP